MTPIKVVYKNLILFCHLTGRVAVYWICQNSRGWDVSRSCSCGQLMVWRSPTIAPTWLVLRALFI